MMSIWSHWKILLKKVLQNPKFWISLFLHLLVVLIAFFLMKQWFLARQWKEVKGSSVGYAECFNPTINQINDFFVVVFFNLLVFSLLVWTSYFSPFSWLLSSLVNEMVNDEIDSLCIIFETPTSRKRIFWRKVAFLFSFLLVLYTIVYALPFVCLLGKVNYFQNFTSFQTFSFVIWSFLPTFFFFLFPVAVLLFSSLSLNSTWYILIRWFLTFLSFIILLVGIRENA